MAVKTMLEAAVDWQLRLETEPVQRKHKAIAAAIAVGVLTANVIAGMLAPRHVVDGWRFLGSMVLSTPYFLCAGIGIFGLSGLSRKLTWQRGYQAGRKSFLVNLTEAVDRGMQPIEWLAAEFERDGHPVRVGYYDGEPVGLDVALPLSWQRRRPTQEGPADA